MKILIIDNYDSFTFNLYQYAGEILKDSGKDFAIDVVRNDQISLEGIKKRKYDRVIISPGPGDPSDSAYFGVCGEVIIKLGKKIPILGVCLGMQGMAYYFGGRVIKARLPMHGKISIIKHDGKGVFKGLPQNLEVMRYHSLIAEKETLPKVLEITAEANGEIMGLRHKKYPVEGIQFHPESILTNVGHQLIKNWLAL